MHKGLGTTLSFAQAKRCSRRRRREEKEETRHLAKPRHRLGPVCCVHATHESKGPIFRGIRDEHLSLLFVPFLQHVTLRNHSLATTRRLGIAHRERRLPQEEEVLRVLVCEQRCASHRIPPLAANCLSQDARDASASQRKVESRKTQRETRENAKAEDDRERANDGSLLQ